MSKPKVPSLQHLARNWRNDATKIKKLLVRLALNPPNFNYDPLFGALRDMLLFGQSFEQIAEGIRRGTKRADLRDNYLEILPLIRDHFRGTKASFVQAVDRRFYPIGKGLLVPFTPPLIYGVGGKIRFPWFSFWRSNPLESESLSLFVTVVDDMLAQDPDLEKALFEILDFSAAGPDDARQLTVINTKDIPRVSEIRKREMLDLFVEGLLLARTELTKSKPAEFPDQPSDSGSPPHPDLFDR